MTPADPSGHVLLAPDKFKGTLTAGQVAGHLRAGLLRADPALRIRTVPVADGGEGTVAVAVQAGFARRTVRVAGPTGEPVRAAYAVRGGTAVIELADASGLRRLPGGRPRPLHATSHGAGELIRAALDDGCRRLVLGLGGSAGTDGGTGLVRALGARLLDGGGAELAPGGGDLARLATLDLSGLDARLAQTELIVATDVDNPLLGPRGAAAVYGPQKGATPDQVARLQAGLRQWAAVVTAAIGRDRAATPGISLAVRPTPRMAATPGAGAAGGTGFAALALLGARLRSGAELMLELAGFAGALGGARLVITGEGRLDEQTLSGKAPAGVAAAARRAGVPVVAVAGTAPLSADRIPATGLRAVYTLSGLEPDLARCLTLAGPLLERLAARIAAEWLAGRPSSPPAPRLDKEPACLP